MNNNDGLITWWIQLELQVNMILFITSKGGKQCYDEVEVTEKD